MKYYMQKRLKEEKKDLKLIIRIFSATYIVQLIAIMFLQTKKNIKITALKVIIITNGEFSVYFFVSIAVFKSNRKISSAYFLDTNIQNFCNIFHAKNFLHNVIIHPGDSLDALSINYMSAFLTRHRCLISVSGRK